MATYAIGDLQGCYQAFKALLNKIQFNQNRDQLWLVGDLVNRGPNSLETLQLVYELNESARIVLGNHDLHLIANAYGVRQQQPGDTIAPILDHPQCDELITWLTSIPLMQRDEALNICMTHAGIPHLWSIEKAMSLAQEASDLIKSASAPVFKKLFKNTPDSWSDELTTPKRERCIINYFTRMRYLHKDGTLDLNSKDSPKTHDNASSPWFEFYDSAPLAERLLFGHWATLNGQTNHSSIFALDTGCIWGNALTALRIEDLRRFSVSAI